MVRVGAAFRAIARKVGLARFFAKNSNRKTMRTVAVAGGTGGLGLFITNGLLDSGLFKVVVLTRRATQAKGQETDALTKKGALVVAVDYGNEQDLVSALTGVDVVVSTLAAGLTEDFALLKAAKAAGVKRFVPSNFGCDHSLEVPKNLPLFQGKYAVMDAVEKSGLEWTYIEVGFFTDLTFFPVTWNADFSNVLDGKVSIVGDGKARFSLTHRADVGRFTAAILNDWEGSKNQRVRVCTETLTMNDVVAKFERLLGKKIEVTYRPIADVKAKMFELMGTNFMATIPDQLNSLIAEGGALMQPVVNDKYPSVTNLITLDDYLKGVLPAAPTRPNAKTVAIAGGTGGVGIHITRALLASGAFKVIVLTRKSATDKAALKDELTALGATVKEVDYSDEHALVATLKGVDAILSALAPGGPEDGLLLAAGKAAGVKRYVPSHFGVDHSNPVPKDIPLFGGKYAFMDALEKSGLEWTYIEVGFFTDQSFLPVTWNDGFVGVLDGHVTIVGDGNTKFSMTHRADVGRFTAAILEDWEGSRNKRVTVCTETVTLNEVVALFEKLTGKKIEVTHRPFAEVKAKIFETIGTDFFATIPDQLNWGISEGGAVIANPMNAHYPSVKNLITLEEHLKGVLAEAPARPGAKTVAIAGGTGGVGIHITRALLASGAFKVIVLTRKSATDKVALKDELKALGATIKEVDYSDEHALLATLKGVDAILSALAPGGSEDSLLLAAGKAAGVKRYVPSHFGVDHSNPVPKEIPLFGGKYAFMDAIEKSGLEWTYIEVGFFTDQSFLPVTWNDGFAGVLDGHVTIVGDGNTKFSMTHRADVGRFTAAILEDWEGSRNKRVTVCTETVTLNEVVALFEKLTGKKIEVTRRPIAEVKAKIFETIGTDFFATIPDQLNWAISEGGAVIANPMNAHYPSVKNLITLQEHLAPIVAATKKQ